MWIHYLWFAQVFRISSLFQVIGTAALTYFVNLNFRGSQETQEQYNRKKADLEQKLLREKAELAKVSVIRKRKWRKWHK